MKLIAQINKETKTIIMIVLKVFRNKIKKKFHN